MDLSAAVAEANRPTARPSRSRRAAALLAATIGVSLALTACASGDDAGGDDSASGTTVLKVYGWKGGDAEPANIKQVNDAFAAANPDIDLQFEFVPANDAYTQRVQPELLGGKGADVIMTDSAKVQDWGSSGYLEDLTDADWVDRVLPNVQPFVTQDDAVYALPMEVIGISLYANLDVLDKAGVTTVPTTWPEFLDALQAAKDAGVTPLSVPNKGGWTGATLLNVIAATRVYQDNPDFDAEFNSGDASFSDWKDSAEQMMQLQDKGFVDFKSELGIDEWGQGITDFQAGKSAFYIQGAWNQAAFEKAGMRTAFIPWPGGDAGVEPTANLFIGTMWSVNAQSKVKDAAERYLDFWSESENASPYLAAENAVTPFVDGTSPSSDATTDFVAAVADGRQRILPTNSYFDVDGEKFMQQQVQALWLGQTSIDDMLTAFDATLRD